MRSTQGEGREDRLVFGAAARVDEPFMEIAILRSRSRGRAMPRPFSSIFRVAPRRRALPSRKPRPASRCPANSARWKAPRRGSPRTAPSVPASPSAAPFPARPCAFSAGIARRKARSRERRSFPASSSGLSSPAQPKTRRCATPSRRRKRGGSDAGTRCACLLAAGKAPVAISASAASLAAASRGETRRVPRGTKRAPPAYTLTIISSCAPFDERSLRVHDELDRGKSARGFHKG